MASSRKKVIVRLLEGESREGYLPLTGVLDAQGAVALLDLEGRLSAIPLSAVKHIAYVRDFNLGETDPERLSRKTFLARPRMEGVWLRLTLPGGEVLEGIAPLDAGLADGLLEDRGFYLTPPDIRSNTQRLFVPRAACTTLQVVGVITTPTKPKVVEKGTQGQERLFP